MGGGSGRLVVGLVLVALLATTVVPAPGVSAEDHDPPSSSEGRLPGGTSLSVGFDAQREDGGLRLDGLASLGEGEAVGGTTMIYVLDVSGSVRNPGGCGAGDQNGDGRSDDILDCQIAAARALNDAAVEAGTVAEAGVAIYGLNGAPADVRPETGIQLLTGPATDANDSGLRDVEEVLTSVRVGEVRRFTRRTVGSWTNFQAGIDAACDALSVSTQPNNVVVFMSDGFNNRGSHVSGALPCDPPATFHTFAVGTGSACTSGGSRGGLQDIADLTGGECTNVTDIADLPDVLPGIVRSRLTRLEVTVDGGDPVDITDSAAPALPATGPVSVTFVHVLEGLDAGPHEVCVTATGQDAGGEGAVTHCETVTTNRPPVADAGPDVTVEEGGVVQLDGSSSFDPDSDPLTYTWELISSQGPPITLSSTTSVAPSFLAIDDGRYTFRLTVDDGREQDDDEVTVTVANADPVIDAAVTAGFAGGISLVTATLTDPGWVDVHEATVDFGDGTDEVAATVTQGAGWGALFASHVYEDAGSYEITVTARDDDGGVATQTLIIEVALPVAVWADSTTATRSLDWSGGGGAIEGRVHSNNELRVRGASKQVLGGTTYAGSISADTDRHVFEPLPEQVEVADVPVTFDLADYRSGGRAAMAAGEAYHDRTGECGSSGTWHSPNQPLEPGLYYADCDIKLNGADIGGEVTLVAEGRIEIAGARPAFQPYLDGLLALAGADGDRAVQISAANSRYLGYVVAPEGGLTVSGNDNRFACGLLADTIDLSGSRLEVVAGDCARPDVTGPAPLLVPDLTLDLDSDADEVLPADQIAYGLELRNDRALLALPGVLFAENVDDRDATLTAWSVALEYLDADEGRWVPLAAAGTHQDGAAPAGPEDLGELALRTTANPATGVAYPQADDALLGTTLAPGSLASWGAQAEIDLDAGEVELLTDPDQAVSVRSVVRLRFGPDDVQVRRSDPFGHDLGEQLRTLSGDADDIEVTFLPPVGDPVVLTAADDTSLVSLAPGAATGLTTSWDVPVPADRGGNEPTDAYLTRLGRADGASLLASSFALGSGGVGRIVAPQVTAASIQHLPIVELATEVPVTAAAGETVTSLLRLRNGGGADATDIEVTDTLDGEPTELRDTPPRQLVPAELAEVTTAADLPSDHPGGLLDAVTTAAWQDANGTTYGPIEREATITVATAADLTATQFARLHLDAGGDGLVGPGDTLRYTTTIDNRGDLPAAGVVYTVPLDANLELVDGSVTTTHGSVTEAGDEVVVEVGPLSAGDTATVVFDAAIVDPLPEGVRTVEVQGTVTADGRDPLRTHDPARADAPAPTLTRLVVGAPAMTADLVDRLVVDRAGDGQVRPGDTLGYTATLYSYGNAPVRDATFTGSLDDHLELVPDSVTTTLGAPGEPSGDPNRFTVLLGDVPAFSEVTVTFRARIADELHEGVDEVAAQGRVDSDDIAPVLTGDPRTAEDRDPTITRVARTITEVGKTPTVGQVTPEDGTVVTGPVEVTASLQPPDGEQIASWQLSYRRPGDATSTVLASGEGPPGQATTTAASTDLETMEDAEEPVVLGVFDPTVLANGMWLLEVTATSTDGGTRTATTSVLVDGQLKLGRYEVAYEDLMVPVAGQPIGVRRSYDSFDRATGDFGVGWNLELADFRVETARPLGQGGWRQVAHSCGLVFCQIRYETDVSHTVAVTWPDGTQERFDLTPVDGSTFFRPATAAAFTAQPGTTSQLEPVGSTALTYLDDGNLYGGGFGVDGIYDPQRFRLTDRSGTVYLLDRDQGLLSTTDRRGVEITFSEDGITSSTGDLATFVRDDRHRIVEIVGPDGAGLTYTYDAAGDLVEVRNARGNSTTYTYDDHRLVGIEGPDGQPLTILAYDDDGRLIAVTDAAGNATEVSTDVDERTEVVTHPDGQRTTVTTFDERGNPVRLDEVFDGQTLTTTFEYDEFDRLTLETDAAGNATSATWSEDGDLLSVVDPEGRRTEFHYNDVGLPVQVIAPGGQVELELEYDQRGNLTGQRQADGAEVAYDYDTRGRMIAATGPGGQVLQFTYDDVDNLVEVRDATGDTVTYTYDDAGRVTGLSDAAGRSVGFDYDADGNVIEVLDPLGRARTYAYDAFGQVLATTDPTGATSSYEYDRLGNLVRRIDRNGDETTFAYDRMGRLTERVLPGAAVTSYDYDGLGRLTSLENDDASIEFEYDQAGDLIRQRTAGPHQPAVELFFAYDRSGLPTATVGPGGTTSTTYDDAGRMAELSVDGGVFTFSYDDAGRITGIARPNGVNDHLEWTPFGTMLERVAGPADTPLALNRYQLDDRGRRTALTDLDGDHAFQFDAAGHLTAVTRPDASGLPDENFAYDAVGNRRSPPGDPTPTTHDDTNRLLRDQSRDFDYDLEGRVVASTDRSTDETTTFTWDADGQLLEVGHPDGTTSTYRYDPLGRRIETDHAGQVTRYVYDGWNPTHEFDDDGQLLATHATGPEPGLVLASRIGEDWRYPLADSSGSTVAVTNAGGEVIERTRYEVFGQPQATPDYRTFAFTGHQYDAPTGLYYARARYYDPSSGRFLSEDPLATLNLYAYPGNDPVHLIDPTGAAAAVEYRMVGTVQAGLTRALAQEGGIFICRQLVSVAIAGLTGGAGAGSPLLGAAAEQAISQATGLPRNHHPRTALGRGPGQLRIPDFLDAAVVGESKHVRRLSDSAQLRDTQRLARESRRPYVVFARASEVQRLAESGRSGLIRRASPGSGLAVLGCLPG